MRRRDFISAIAGAAAWPLEADATNRPGRDPATTYGASEKQERAKSIRHCLSEAGYDAGRNASIEYGWAETHLDRLPALATQLVRRNARRSPALRMTVDDKASLRREVATLPGNQPRTQEKGRNIATSMQRGCILQVGKARWSGRARGRGRDGRANARDRGAHAGCRDAGLGTTSTLWDVVFDAEAILTGEVSWANRKTVERSLEEWARRWDWNRVA